MWTLTSVFHCSGFICYLWPQIPNPDSLELRGFCPSWHPVITRLPAAQPDHKMFRFVLSCAAHSWLCRIFLSAYFSQLCDSVESDLTAKDLSTPAAWLKHVHVCLIVGNSGGIYGTTSSHSTVKYKRSNCSNTCVKNNFMVKPTCFSLWPSSFIISPSPTVWSRQKHLVSQIVLDTVPLCLISGNVSLHFITSCFI